MLAPQDLLGQLPTAASTFTAELDALFDFVWVICAFFFVLITGILAFSVVRWRRKQPEQPPASAVTHNTVLEVVWTVIPLIIVMVIFAWGWKGSIDMTVAPADALTYEAIGRQWSWSIKHPDTDQAVPNEMYVPLDKPVRVNLHSQDVLHSFFIPAFRVKRDVLPGRYQMVWFQPNRLGTFNLFCTEYCGERHSYMIGKVHVITQAEFAKKPWVVARPDDPVEWGKLIAKQNGCTTCHSTDGTQIVGPTWKGVWGREEELMDGSTVTVDREYVIESIRQPMAKVVKRDPPYPPMTAFPQLKDEEIDALIEYMKTLK